MHRFVVASSNINKQISMHLMYIQTKIINKTLNYNNYHKDNTARDAIALV